MCRAGKFDDEGRSEVGAFALRADGSTVEIDGGAGDGKAQPDSAKTVIAVERSLIEGQKYLLELGGSNADTRNR